MFKIASWNVNSLKVRLDQVLSWLDISQVDVLAIQETKMIDEQFPREAIEQKGYHIVFSGQKNYNGVAIISRHPITDVVTDIPGLIDAQRRILAASIAGIRVINLYVPNGSEVGSEKYAYKLDWLNKVTDYVDLQLKTYAKVVVLGDFNIAPHDCDVFDPIEWKDCILVSAPERQALNKMLDLGLHDSFRQFAQEEGLFSWWDYRAAGFRRNRGLRIDLILLNQELSTHCLSSAIDKEPRKVERPSDHAPVWVALDVSAARDFA